MDPQENRYTKDHEWVKVAGSRGTVGITDYAQKQLGDVVFVELPAVGDSVEAGKRFGTVESVKAVSELYAPVTGKVIEVHEALTQKPETLNTDPYGEGWMIVVELADPKSVGGLMDAAQYQAYVASEKK
jgi:glycine cleavage system H protein